MKKERQDLWGTIKEESMLIRASFAGVLLALGFWGVAFPQYLFAGDCVKVFCADGREEEEREDKNLYREIGTAKPEQIEVKISILEWAKR